MKKQWSVTEPYALPQYTGNNHQYEQDLANFTKSVIDLEAVICHKSRKPNPMVVHEKSAAYTLQVPQGADEFALRQCHANLKQFRNLESCTNGLVISGKEVSQSPLKQPSPTIGNINENELKQGINENPLFRSESDSRIGGDIHLSRVYFSQQSTNGNQTLQEAQNTDFQPVSEAPSKCENKTQKKRQKVHFNECAVQRRLIPMEAKKHPSHTSTTNKQIIKGLFQKPSSHSRKCHQMLSDKYVYFFSEPEHSSLTTDKDECSQFKQQLTSGINEKQREANINSSSLQKRKISDEPTLHEEKDTEKDDSSQMQVVVGSDGRVLVNVVHGKQKTNQQTPLKPQDSPDRPTTVDYVNNYEHLLLSTYNKPSPGQESSPPAGQTKHIYAKMKIDGSFSAIQDANYFQDNKQTVVYPRGYGNKVVVVNKDGRLIGNKPAYFHRIPPGKSEGEYDYHGYERRYVYPPRENLPISPQDNYHFRDRQPPPSLCSTADNRRSFINYQENTEQNTRNAVGNTSRPIHSPVGNGRTTSLSNTSADHSFTSHQETTPKTIHDQKGTNQPTEKGSEVEVDVNTQSRNGDLTADKRDTHENNERRYRCDWPACSKAFRHYSFLVLHRRIHTGERPYNCSWKGCQKQFRRSDDYQRHYRVHTGVKPYPCSICGKAFKRSDHRLFHYRAIHNMYKQ